MITENLSTLKIHKLTQEQYERELEAGRIDENALYLTPDEEVDLSDYYTKEEINTAINTIKEELSESIVAESNEWKVVDEAGNVIFSVDAEGAHTTNLILNGEEVATEAYVNEGLAEKQPIGDYAFKSDIPEVSPVIIDVVELPAENINEQAFYRLNNVSASVVANGEVLTDWVIHTVDTLPEIGEPVSTDMIHYILYYNKQDRAAYGYADENLSAAYSIPAGWYSIDTVFQLGGKTFGGYIDDLNESVDSDHMFVYVEHISDGVYSSKNSTWTRHDSMTIIDVVELPTENINEAAIYRLVKGGMLVIDRADIHGKGQIDLKSCFIVDALPESAIGFNTNYGGPVVYYNVSDSTVYAYVSDRSTDDVGLPIGWYPAEDVMHALTGEDAFAGVVTSINECVKEGAVYLLLDVEFYAYASGWTSFSRCRSDIGEYSEIHNYALNMATGLASFAEGYDTTASDWGAHAEGIFTKAFGSASHAEGWGATASGSCSHAEGEGTIASGSCSHAEGEGTIAYSNYQHVQGKYNIESIGALTYAHIVGNGSTIADRSNAHTLDWDGNAWFAGDVYVGSRYGTNRDDGSKKLATEDRVIELINEALEVIENGTY